MHKGAPTAAFTDAGWPKKASRKCRLLASDAGKCNFCEHSSGRSSSTSHGEKKGREARDVEGCAARNKEGRRFEVNPLMLIVSYTPGITGTPSSSGFFEWSTLLLNFFGFESRCLCLPPAGKGPCRASRPSRPNGTS